VGNDGWEEKKWWEEKKLFSTAQKCLLHSSTPKLKLN
jgi:hypothetical protein